MRVILELMTGSGARRRVSLMRNQEVVVGRSSWADFAVSDDPKMAEKHFRLETDLNACRLTDLSLGVGTFLNGQPVVSAAIRNNDLIQAGESQFLCHVEGVIDQPDEPRELVRPVQAPQATKKPLSKGEFFTTTCKTGLYQAVGRTDAVQPAELVAKLGELQPLSMVVDFRRIEGASSPDNGQDNYLFDWLGDAAESNSPVLLHTSDGDLNSFVEQGWGCDAIICLFWHAEKQAVANHLRNFLRTADNQIIGICWPSILDVLLQHYHQDYVQSLMQPLAGFFMESATEEDTWHLYSKSDMSKTLEMIGLNRRDLSPEVAKLA